MHKIVYTIHKLILYGFFYFIHLVNYIYQNNLLAICDWKLYFHVLYRSSKFNIRLIDLQIYQRMDVNCKIRFNSIVRYNFLSLDVSARSFTNRYSKFPKCSKYLYYYGYECIESGCNFYKLNIKCMLQRLFILN